MDLNYTHTKLKWIVLTLLLSFLLGGCKAINQFLVKPMIKPTGDAVTLMGEAHVTPYLLTTDDLEAGCAGAEALGGLIGSIGRVTEQPYELMVMLGLAGGGCEEARAFEKELEYLRAIRAQQPDNAQDALVLQKRHHLKAARRYYKAWLDVIDYNNGKEVGGKCPELIQEFDQIVWLAGMVAGLQALNQDILSGVGIGVPKNIAAQVERGVGCLDNNNWFGAPMAIKAAIWLLLPGALPEGEDAWARLEQSDLLGEKAHVRLSHVLHAFAAYSKGDMERVRKVIKRHAEQIEEFPANSKYKLFDASATEILTRMSDKMWTEAMGYRTPVGQLGTFWDDDPSEGIQQVELDDLF